MKKGPMIVKSQEFANRSIEIYKMLTNKGELVISRQFLASATSVGANVREATAASSRKDFINKMTIASKEARESKYWLELIKNGDFIDYDLNGMLALNEELIKLLNSIIMTSKGIPKKR